VNLQNYQRSISTLATEASVTALNGRGYDQNDVLPQKNYAPLMLPDSRRKKIKKILENDKKKRSQEGIDDHVGRIHPSLVAAAKILDPFVQATMAALSEHLQNDFSKLLLNSTLDDDVTILFGEKNNSTWWQQLRSNDWESQMKLETLCFETARGVVELLCPSIRSPGQKQEDESLDFKICQLYNDNSIIEIFKKKYKKCQINIAIHICVIETRAFLCKYLLSNANRVFHEDSEALMNEVYNFFGAAIHETEKKILNKKQKYNPDLHNEMCQFLRTLYSKISPKTNDSCTNGAVEDQDIMEGSEHVRRNSTNDNNFEAVMVNCNVRHSEEDDCKKKTHQSCDVSSNSNNDCEPGNFVFRNQGGLVKPCKESHIFALALIKKIIQIFFAAPVNRNTMSIGLDAIFSCKEIEKKWNELVASLGFETSSAAIKTVHVLLTKYTYHARANQFLLDFARSENTHASTSKRRQGVRSTVKAYMIIKDEKNGQ
jgi:hypothetical protein